jgi:hypothetical protein
MKQHIFIVLILLSTFNCYAQMPVFVNGQFMSGAVMPHREGMEMLRQGMVKGGELEIGLQLNRNEDWHVAYSYPMTGFGVHYNYLNNPEMLGYAAGIYGFIEIPVFRSDEFEMLYRLTSGLSYLSKRYSETENPENIAISTRANYLFHTGFRFRYWMSEETAIGIGGGLSHYSNGGTNTPNKGLNQLNIHAGLTHYISGKYHDYSGVKRPIVWQPQHEIYLLGVYGYVDIPKNSPKNSGTDQSYPTAGISLGYNYRYAAMRKIGLSLDGFYNESYNWTYWDGFISYGYNWKQLSRLGIAIQHEFMMKRLSIIIAGGTYLKAYQDLEGTLTIKSEEWAYERVGFRYYPIPNVFINLSVKAYGFKAETVEAGIGFSIKTHQN